MTFMSSRTNKNINKNEQALVPFFFITKQIEVTFEVDMGKTT